MTPDQFADHMSTLTMALAERTEQAANHNPAVAGPLAELALSAVAGLEIGQRMLLEFDDIITATVMIETAKSALRVIAANGGTNHESA